MNDNIKAMSRVFKWIDWNLEHATRHGITVSEIEAIVSHPAQGPRHVGDNKYVVVGRGIGERVIEVVYVIDAAGPVFVIHAQQVTTRRRRRGR
jgi:hypothetical protein